MTPCEESVRSITSSTSEHLALGEVGSTRQQDYWRSRAIQYVVPAAEDALTTLAMWQIIKLYQAVAVACKNKLHTYTPYHPQICDFYSCKALQSKFLFCISKTMFFGDVVCVVHRACVYCCKVAWSQFFATRPLTSTKTMQKRVGGGWAKSPRKIERRLNIPNHC